MNTDTKINTRRVKIVCCEPNSSDDPESPDSEYFTFGHLLPDGRLLTLETGMDGKDSLWASVDDYEPNGLARVLSYSILHNETGSVTIEDVVKADEDNRVYSGRSLLTADELKVAAAQKMIAPETSDSK